ncbi:hypothetical protein N6G96_07170 [Pediococcus inopinatus]|uniref:DNA-directed RNA polymerase beta subunit n=1 Tax=Pediococcus inopinatus TaxID=114090 RepID=A0ABZ0Q285_9LACO|nr:hypothetical protein [Pediococcus inopinatus]WPC19280.1 hypothetical protein N6G95_08595 [Pediococcus inopinatus]WPC21070.1 hypothetical protein N6G96_07170 [Pediococcus inopinatus]
MIIERVDESVTENFFEHDYKDRGMLKWGGFFLSDHTSALKKMKAEVEEKLLPKQDQKTVSSLLLSAWKRKRIVHVQLLALRNEEVESYTGLVMGHNDEGVVIQENNEAQNNVVVELELVRNVHNYVDNQSWKNSWKNDVKK